MTPDELEQAARPLAGKLAFITMGATKDRLIDVEHYDAINKRLMCYFRFDRETRRGGEPLFGIAADQIESLLPAPDGAADEIVFEDEK
jgi:hypothetical protein